MMGSLTILFAAGLHILQMDCAVTEPEEGFVLGNGDLSVSAYQTMDAIVFRFGKGDVWDRRIETEKDPPPCTVRNYKDIALGRKDPGGFTNRSNGVSKAYPMPKPVGELKLHVPSNLPGHPTWRQRLVVEEGRIEISAEWESGVKVDVEAVVDPNRNDFACRWRCSGWDDDTRLGRGEPPVFFTLEREADPTPQEFLSDVASVGFSTPTGIYPDCEPLPPPVAVSDAPNGLHYIEQRFHPDNLFPAVHRQQQSVPECGILLIQNILKPLGVFPGFAKVFFRTKAVFDDGHRQILLPGPDSRFLRTGRLEFGVGENRQAAVGFQNGVLHCGHI